MSTVTPDSSAPSSGASSRKIKLPLAGLAVDGTEPAQGDEVTFTVTAKLGAVSGKDGEFEVSAINGEPIGEASPEMSEDDAALAAATKADGGDGY